jgi:hypothetical protein
VLQLVQLTSLSLKETGADGAAVAAVSRLTQLQRLRLVDVCTPGYMPGDQAPVPLHMQHLPSSLTLLKLTACQVCCNDSRPNSRGQQLGRLKELSLDLTADFQLEVLEHMTSLTHVSADGFWPEELAALLGALPLLTQLRHLHLQEFSAGSAGELPPAASYVALTASSQLTVLLLSCGMHHDAARHMFAAGRQLPHLQRLEIGDRELDHYSPLTGFDNDAFLATSLALRPGVAAQLVACCPNLRSLSLLWALELTDASHLQPLLLLTGLTSLMVGGDGWDDTAAGTVLAGMTGGSAFALRVCCDCIYGNDHNAVSRHLRCLRA